MNIDELFWSSLNDHWKQIIIRNICVQENIERLPEFSFWNGIQKNYKELGMSDNDNLPDKPISLPHKIDIFSSSLTSLEALNGTREIQEFYMGNTAIIDITPICNNSQMTKLCCYNSPIQQIEPLANLSKLKRLCLSKTMITNIEPIRSLVELEKLALYHTEVTDIEPLSQHFKLKKLNINFTKVKDITCLYELHCLEELHCYRTFIPAAQIVEFQIKRPECTVIHNYEKPENEYDDFQ